MDISKLSRKDYFFIQTQSLGKLNFSRVNMKLLSVSGKMDLSACTAYALIDEMILVLGEKEGGQEIKREDLSKITDDEKENFVDAFILAHPELSIPRNNEEKPSEHLLNFWKPYLAKWKEREKKLLESLTKWADPYKDIFKLHTRIFDPSMKKLLEDNFFASSSLRKLAEGELQSIKAFQQQRGLEPHSARAFAELPRLPENPAHETNRKLQHVINKFDKIEEFSAGIAQTVASLNDAASDFLIKFASASEDANEAATEASGAAKWGLRIAIVALIIAPIQFLYSIWSDAQSVKEQAALVERLNSQILSLKAKQSEDISVLIQELKKASANEVKAIKQAKPTDKK